jgi:hypothetical protein
MIGVVLFIYHPCTGDPARECGVQIKRRRSSHCTAAKAGN